ncbi:hypothetical protein AAMO2058_001504100 [Amorphochlora amoebiformis]
MRSQMLVDKLLVATWNVRTMLEPVESKSSLAIARKNKLREKLKRQKKAKSVNSLARFAIQDSCRKVVCIVISTNVTHNTSLLLHVMSVIESLRVLAVLNVTNVAHRINQPSKQALHF